MTHLRTIIQITFCCSCNSVTSFTPSPPPVVQQPLVSQGVLIIEASWSHTDTPQLVWPWASDQTIAETLPDNTQHLQAGFEPAVPASEQLQTQSIDHVVTGVFICPFEVFGFCKLWSLVSGMDSVKVANRHHAKLLDLKLECIYNLNFVFCIATKANWINW